MAKNRFKMNWRKIILQAVVWIMIIGLLGSVISLGF